MCYILLIMSLIGIVASVIYLIIDPGSCAIDQAKAVFVIIVSGPILLVCLDHLVDNPNR